ncbi:MAG: hypothetical protein H7A33_05900 [Deltaproteobacteria bacterium]|nr:hypothetical protein [Deltaproteobacteria bacterium]
MKKTLLGTIARAFVLFSLTIFISCSGAGGGIGGSIGGGSGGGAGGSDTSSAAGEIDGVESELFESGPESLPVTIAKLESVDFSKVDATYSDSISNSVSGSGSFLKYQSSGSSGFTFSGTAGAVDNDEIVFIVGDETFSQTVNDDGSFDAVTVSAETGDLVYVASRTESTGEIGLPFIVKRDSNGVIRYILTNAETINSVSPVSLTTSSDDTRYFYFATEDTSGDQPKFNLYRKAFMGSEFDLIAEDLGQNVRYVTARDDDVLYVIRTGEVMNALASTSGDTTTWSYGNNQEPLYSTDSWIETDTYAAIPSFVEVYWVSDSQFFVANRGNVTGNDGGAAEDQLLSLVTMTSSGALSQTQTVIGSGTYDDMIFSYNESSLILTVLLKRKDTTTWELRELDLSDGISAFDNSSNLRTVNFGSSPLQLDTNPEGVSLFSAFDTTFVDYYAVGESLALDFVGSDEDLNNVASADPVLLLSDATASAVEFVFCADTNADNDAETLVYARESSGVLSYYYLTPENTFDACEGPITLSDDDLLFFYVRGQTTERQINVIDMKDLDTSNLQEIE